MRKLNHLASFLALIVVKDMESKKKKIINIFEKIKFKKKGKGIQRAVNLFRPGRFFKNILIVPFHTFLILTFSLPVSVSLFLSLVFIQQLPGNQPLQDALTWPSTER